MHFEDFGRYAHARTGSLCVYSRSWLLFRDIFYPTVEETTVTLCRLVNLRCERINSFKIQDSNDCMKTRNSYAAGDLKLQNFCLSEPRSSGKPLDELLRIIDFGLSRRIRVGNYIHDSFGTIEYLAPEVVRRHFDHKVDIWSLGVILYQLTTVLS